MGFHIRYLMKPSTVKWFQVVLDTYVHPLSFILFIVFLFPCEAAEGTKEKGQIGPRIWGKIKVFIKNMERWDANCVSLEFRGPSGPKKVVNAFSSSTAGLAIRCSWVFASSTLFGESRTNGALTDGGCHWKPGWKLGKGFQGIKSIRGQKHSWC